MEAAEAKAAAAAAADRAPRQTRQLNKLPSDKQSDSQSVCHSVQARAVRVKKGKKKGRKEKLCFVRLRV